MVYRLPIESRLVVVWLGLLLRMDDVCGFVIPIRHQQIVSQCITHHPIVVVVVVHKKKRRLRNVADSRCTRLTSLSSLMNDEWNNEKEESDESQTPVIVSYDDFEDFALTTGMSPSSSFSSSSSSTTTTFYNDFDDQTVGIENDDMAMVHPTSSSHSSSDDDENNGRMKTNKEDVLLLSRMSSLQREEQRRVAVCDRNWKLGNWFVRGFSLEETTNPIPSVSTIVTSSSVANVYSDDNDDDDMDTLQKQIDVWVGRTDGSIFGIRFGTDYWTRLGNSEATLDEFESLGINKDTVNSDGFGGDDNNDDDDDSGVTFSTEPTEMNPFTIVTQFKCTGSSAITSIVALPAMATINDDDDDDTETMNFDIYVACKDSMVIEHWYYDGNGVSLSNSFIATQSSQKKASSILTLRQIHTMVNNVPTTMILAVNDGSMTLWDIKTDTMIGFIDTIQIPDVTGGSGSYGMQTITCIDTDNEFVYVGTESGYVLVYAIHDILQQNYPQQSVSISAVGCWRAAPTDDCSMTAIQCGGPGTLGRNSASTTSSILYTGDAQGLVKQWEVLKMLSNSATTSNDNDRSTDGRKKYKIEAWPKLSTQRLPKKAHVFKGHSAAITGLLSVDALKFVSASADGTVRAWNTASGKELFRMDGFPDPIRSLCLLDSDSSDESTDRLRNTILVTDGMDKYVCVHDFSADDEDTADYDLEMPEYIS